VAFDLLRQTAEDTAAWPYERRRAAPQTPLTENDLTAPWALGPSTTDPDTVREWLTWTAVGLEGLPFKRLDSPYRPAVRGWRKYKVARARRDRRRRRPPAPRSLLLGRFDTDERWQYTGRSTTLTQAAGATLASLLSPAAGEHPWTGWTFTAG
jgi:ATP-dependent DNA ligase